jgi:hypothetical protein
VPDSATLTKSTTDALHTTNAVQTRMRTALETLYDLCATEDARRSFLIWQAQLANSLGMPGLGQSVKPARLPKAFGSCDVGLGLDGGVIGVTKKGGLMERLLGKARRRSAAVEACG